MKVPISIFVINLKKDLDRKKNISQQFERLNIDFDFFSAINGRELSESELNKAYNPNNSLDKGVRLLTKGEIGCALSHFSVYQKIIDEDIGKAIIFEDDAVLGNNFTNAIKIIEYLPKNWELLLLGYSSSREVPCNFDINIDNNPTQFNIGISPKKRGCLHGYVISNKGAKRMISYKDSLYQAIDMYSADYRLINSYIITPRVVHQDKKFESSIGYEWEDEQGPEWKKQKIIKFIRGVNNNRRKNRISNEAFSISCIVSKIKFLFKFKFKVKSYYE